MAESISWRRTTALCRKEFLQILRDPSSQLIAFVLPMLMIFIFGYGLNLDANRVAVGLLNEDSGAEASELALSITGSPFLVVHPATSRQELNELILRGDIRGFVVIPEYFSERVQREGAAAAPVQVVTDGSEPNTASFVENYLRGAHLNWLNQRALRGEPAAARGVEVQNRYWFNAAAISRNFLVPGSMAIIMTVIGALLTSLVVAREWERGTMEALLATPLGRMEFLLSKLIPYYTLGITSMVICVLTGVFLLGVPFRGSAFLLFVVSSLFLFATLGFGLLVSTLIRNQFNAAQAALNGAFLPALMLSGFIFEIASMPWLVRVISHLFPARYFVACLQTLFQAGTIWGVLLPNGLCLALAAAVFLTLTVRNTSRLLE